jgi:hypothetical protein
VSPPPQTGFGGQAFLDGVSCSSAGDCVAVGQYVRITGSQASFQPLEVIDAGGIFGQGIEVTAPANAFSDAGGQLSGVSCISVGNCLGVGGYFTGPSVDANIRSFGQAMEASETGGTFWQAIQSPLPSNAAGGKIQDAQLSGVSCSSASACVAVGDYIDSSGYQQAMAVAGSLLPPCPTGVQHVGPGRQAAIAATETNIDGQACPGYWVVNNAGQVTAIGAAPWLGDLTGRHLNAPIVAIAATPGRGGYWLVASDGGVFSFGDARFYGSTANIRLNKPVVGIAAGPGGRGYWLVASDGGVFTFGAARFIGSLGGVAIAAPIIGMSPQPSANGYRLVGSDGGVFDFGDARYYGSLPADHVANPQIIAVASSLRGNGYYLVNAQGTVWAFGDAPNLGNA